MPDPVNPQLLTDIAQFMGVSEAEAAATITEVIRGPVAPVSVTGPPCMRCGGDLLDHLLCAPDDGGPDEYRCLRDLAQDVLHDMQTSEPADDGDRVDPAWVEVFEALATAHARSLISHEGPIVVTRGQHMTDVQVAAMDAPTLDACGATATVFAVLRDIADAEPIEDLAYSSEVRCVMCGASATPVAGGRHPHLISCPWQRAVEIVGRGQAAPAQGGDRG